MATLLHLHEQAASCNKHLPSKETLSNNRLSRIQLRQVNLNRFWSCERRRILSFASASVLSPEGRGSHQPDSQVGASVGGGLDAADEGPPSLTLDFTILVSAASF